MTILVWLAGVADDFALVAVMSFAITQAIKYHLGSCDKKKLAIW